MIRSGLLAMWFLVGSAVVAAEPVRWSFESETVEWTPRAPTVSVTRSDGGATPDSTGCLKVAGAIEIGWNYALSPRFPLTAGRLYRLSARLRVVALGAGTPAPSFKCEFVGEPGAPAIGRVVTPAYDREEMDRWQTLEVEFRVPDGTVAGWLALEKGTEAPTAIEAYVDDVTVEEIAALSSLERYRLEPLPATLAALRGVHPRLFVDAARVDELRGAIAGTHQALFAELRAQADRLVKSGPPAYRERDNYSGDEQLWQREVGNAMPAIALCWLLTGERAYLDAARDWALASCAYPTWGLGSIDGMDLASGHQMLGLALVYDWCYGDLDAGALQTIRETLSRRCGVMFERAASGHAWWHRAYLQNHLWVNACGLGAAGLALFDEVDGADRWAGLALDKWRRTLAALGPDGASHEGVGYWQYGVEYLLKFMWLARSLLDVDLYDHPWFRHTAAYARYLTIPRGAWSRSSSLVDIADCPRGNWYGPDYLLRALAAEYRDPYAQHHAAEVDGADIDSPGARWLNLIWYDPTLEPQPPTDLPTLRWFTDLGLVSARTDWSGEESLVVFKCGPYLGHEATAAFNYDPGGGHVHPDAGHFVLFGGGEWLLRDDGYRAKRTEQHNTLLVDGRGQLGEGREWFDGAAALRAPAQPRVLAADSSPTLDLIVGDATAAYPAELGLRRFVRRLLFCKPDALIVVDEIETDSPRELELRFHPEQSAVAEAGAWLAAGKAVTLRLEPLRPEGVTVTAGELAAAGRHGAGAPMFTIRLTTHRSSWRSAVALTWGAPPARVAFTAEGDTWRFAVGDRRLRFDWPDGWVTEE